MTVTLKVYAHIYSSFQHTAVLAILYFWDNFHFLEHPYKKLYIHGCTNRSNLEMEPKYLTKSDV